MSEVGDQLRRFTEERQARLVRAEALVTELAELADRDRQAATSFNREVGHRHLLRLTDVGGLALRDEEHFGQVVGNRVTYALRIKPNLLGNRVSPARPLDQVGQSELEVVEKALRNLGGRLEAIA